MAKKKAKKKAKKASKKDLFVELDELLFKGAGNQTEGLLTFAQRVLVGDWEQKRIARVKEIIEELK